MPQCEYCGQYPFATYCASYFKHVKSCKLSAENATRNFQKESEIRTPTVINNYVHIGDMNIIYNNNFYVNYLSTEFTARGINWINTVSLNELRNLDDYDKFLEDVQEAMNNSILRIHAFTFLADMSRRARERLQRERFNFANTELIRVMIATETDLLDGKGDELTVQTKPTFTITNVD
jgi:hypothetical protein